MAQPLSEEESAPTLAWTGFYCFSGHITVQDDPHLLCTGLLQAITENKGEDVANYIKKEGHLQM